MPPPMMPKERFLAAMRRQPVDRVPLFDFLFQRPLFTQLIGRTPGAYNARDAMDLTRALGLDAVWIPFGAFAGWAPERLADNVYKDEWGTTFEQNEASWPIDAPIAYPLATREDLARWRPPDAAAPGRLAEVETAVGMNRARGADAVAILGGVGGPFTTTWMLLGYERLSLALYDDPDFLRDLAGVALRFARTAATRMAGAGVDGLIISEDLGSSAGGLLNPALFRELYRPVLGELIAHIHGLGMPVFFHSCGCIRDYLADLVELGIDVIHPLQRTAGMDLAEVKRAYGGRVAICGNIDSSRTLPYGTPDAVEAEVREALRIAAPGGGYILASDHSLHDGIPVANVLRLFDAGRRYGSGNA